MVAKINYKECLTCFACVSACPTGAMQQQDKPVVDATKCDNCGKCAEICPAKCITIEGKKE